METLLVETLKFSHVVFTIYDDFQNTFELEKLNFLDSAFRREKGIYEIQT